MFGLAANDPKIIVNGPDPGILNSTGDEGESDLDVEWAGAVAPNATDPLCGFAVDDVEPCAGEPGRGPSALYIIDNNLAPVMSKAMGTAKQRWEQVETHFTTPCGNRQTAQGITVVSRQETTGQPVVTRARQIPMHPRKDLL